MNVFVHYFGLASKFGASINNTRELLLLPSNKNSKNNKKKHTEILPRKTKPNEQKKMFDEDNPLAGEWM